MNWLRQKHWGYGLALLAMVMQLAFSFGHVHLKHSHIDGWLVSSVRAILEQSDHHDCHHEIHSVLAGYELPASVQKHHHDHHHDHQHDENNCPVCWTLGAAGSLILSDNSPTLRLPDYTLLAGLERLTTPVFSYSTTSYRVRAPPPTMIV